MQERASGKDASGKTPVGIKAESRSAVTQDTSPAHWVPLETILSFSSEAFLLVPEAHTSTPVISTKEKIDLFIYRKV